MKSLVSKTTIRRRAIEEHTWAPPVHTHTWAHRYACTHRETNVCWVSVLCALSWIVCCMYLQEACYEVCAQVREQLAGVISLLSLCEFRRSHSAHQACVCLCPLSHLLALPWMVKCRKHRSQLIWLQWSMHSSQKYLVIGRTTKMARKPASKLSSQETHPKPGEEAAATLVRGKQNSNCEACSRLSQLLNHPNHSHLFWRQQRRRQLLYCLHGRNRESRTESVSFLLVPKSKFSTGKQIDKNEIICLYPSCKGGGGKQAFGILASKAGSTF